MDDGGKGVGGYHRDMLPQDPLVNLTPSDTSIDDSVKSGKIGGKEALIKYLTKKPHRYYNNITASVRQSVTLYGICDFLSCY